MSTRVNSLGASSAVKTNQTTQGQKAEGGQTSIEIVKRHTDYNKGVKLESEVAVKKAEGAKRVLKRYGINNVNNERIVDLKQDGTVLVCTYEDGSKLTFDRETPAKMNLNFYNGKYDINGKNFVFEPGRNVTDIHVQPDSEQGELYFHDITNDINVTMNEKTSCAIRNNMHSGDGKKHEITVKKTFGFLNIRTAQIQTFNATP